jgi:hypothetical protein
MANHSFDIQLTDEQKDLYQTSGVFRQGVDLLLRGIIPTFLAGLEVQAEEQDARIEALKQAAMKDPMTITVHPYEAEGFGAGLLRGFEEGRRYGR